MYVCVGVCVCVHVSPLENTVSSTSSSDQVVLETYEPTNDCGRNTIMPEFCSDSMEQDTGKMQDRIISQQQQDIDTCMVKSSSSENIYEHSDFTAKVSDVLPDVHVDVADRYEPTSPTNNAAHGTSNYQSLYVTQETLKESGDVEEKDIDEREKLKREIDEALQHEEKGACENHKVASPEEKTCPSEEYDEFDINSLCVANGAAYIPVDILIESPEVTHTPPNIEVRPIDVTIASGLDRVGYCTYADEESTSKEALSRSSSDHIRTSTHFSDTSSRQRYFSTPEYVSNHSEDSQSSEQPYRGS